MTEEEAFPDAALEAEELADAIAQEREDRILDLLLQRAARLERIESESAEHSGSFQELADRVREADRAGEELRHALRRRLQGSRAATAQHERPVEVAASAVEDDELALPDEGDDEPDEAGTSAAPRTFRLRSPPMTGQDVRQFQRALNKRYSYWDIATRLREDGRFGQETMHAAREVALGLGIAPTETERGITPQVRSVIRKPGLRTREQLERARRRRPWLRQLREKVQPEIDDVLASSEAEPEDAALELDDETGDLDIEDAPSRESVMVELRFDRASWDALEELADAEGVDRGAMLGLIIAREAYLKRLSAVGGQLLLKRGRRIYRLRNADARHRGASRRGRKW